MSKDNPQYITTSLWAKAARKSMKLTQKDLAGMLKISKKSLENYESGRVDVPTATAIALYRICEFAPTFYDPPLEGQSQYRDAEGVKEGEGEEVTAKYISLLEQNVKRLEQENTELKGQITKPSTKPKATKKK